jgi:hypothetical protein
MVVQVVVEVLLVQEILDQVDQEILLTLLQIKEMMVVLVQVNVGLLEMVEAVAVLAVLVLQELFLLEKLVMVELE